MDFIHLSMILYEFLVKYYDFTWIPLSFVMYFLWFTKTY